MLTKAALEAEGTPVVLLFDDLNTHTPSLAWARSAATQYLGKHRPQSNVVILTTSGMLRKQATADAAALEEAVAALTSRSEQILPRTASVLTRLTERMHGGGSNVDH